MVGRADPGGRGVPEYGEPERLAVAGHRSPVVSAGFRQTRDACPDPIYRQHCHPPSNAAGFELTDEDRRIGRYTLRVVRDTIPRCIEAGRFRPAETWSVARHTWRQLHGFVSLELAGYLAPDRPAEDEFREYLRDLAVGAGDRLDRAQASITRAFDTTTHA